MAGDKAVPENAALENESVASDDAGPEGVASDDAGPEGAVSGAPRPEPESSAATHGLEVAELP
jgi:hypothetical protein